MGVLNRQFCPQRTLAISGEILVSGPWGATIGILSVEARNAGEHSTVH